MLGPWNIPKQNIPRLFKTKRFQQSILSKSNIVSKSSTIFLKIYSYDNCMWTLKYVHPSGLLNLDWNSAVTIKHWGFLCFFAAKQWSSIIFLWSNLGVLAGVLTEIVRVLRIFRQGLWTSEATAEIWKKKECSHNVATLGKRRKPVQRTKLVRMLPLKFSASRILPIPHHYFILFFKTKYWGDPPFYIF